MIESVARVCTSCGESKSVDAFHKSGQGNRLRGDCKSCRNARGRTKAMEWWKANKDRAYAIKRRHILKSLYGMSEAEYNLMIQTQGNVCAICGNAESTIRRGRLMRLTVDHDHETGVVRGLLCNRCNRAIGLFRDDPTVMRKALSYVNKSRALTAQGGQ